MGTTTNRKPEGYNTLGNTQVYNGHKSDMKDELTIEGILDHIGFGRSQLALVFLTCIIWLADGMEVMVLSILGPLLQFEWHIAPVQEAMLTSFVMLGMAIGAFFFGYMLDRYGRRKTLILSAIWTVFYAGLAAIVPDFVWMIIVRFLVGLGIAGGMLGIYFPIWTAMVGGQITNEWKKLKCVVFKPEIDDIKQHAWMCDILTAISYTPGVSYYSEFLPTKNRGVFSLLAMFFWSMGGILNVLAAMALMRFGWRVWVLSTAIPGILFLLSSPALPKSPRYELACGRKKEAWAILEKIAAQNGQTLPDVEMKELEVKSKARIADLFVPELRKTSVLLAVLWFFSGFIYYGTILFSTGLIQMGDTCSKEMLPTIDRGCFLGSKSLNMDHYVSLLWTTSAELPGLLLTVGLIDTVGRTKGMAINYTIGGIAIVLLSFCMSKVPMVVSLFVARGVTGSAMQMLFPYTNEIYPTEVRGLASGLGNGLARIGGLITPYFAEVLFSWSVHAGIALYTCIAFMQVFIALIMPIETKGKQMSDSYAI